ncbi:MAG: type IV toxin-antitoxin system AbiEi family antitoxin [Candidatus Melainabacteria bacterium]|nr:type IV toxin-antitoxin system AbiEi family antitoxin [Candidatus Melainabacteria bacterium]
MACYIGTVALLDRLQKVLYFDTIYKRKRMGKVSRCDTLCKHERKRMSRETIAKFVDELPAQGRYAFNRAELQQRFRKSDAAIKLALHRLQQKGRIISPRRGFYVVVPEEYKHTGAPPPAWFIDSLMKDWQGDYYVGLLTAAEIHGAAHQRPQEFQVVADKAHRVIEISRYRIRFFKKWNVKDVPVIDHKTPTGYMKVSTPEATALDLVRYFENVGYFGNVVTVLSELSDVMNGQRLVSAAKRGVEFAVVQRLGYLLDLLGKTKLANPLHDWLSTNAPRITALRTDLDSRDSILNRRWSLYANEQVEAEE